MRLFRGWQYENVRNYDKGQTVFSFVQLPKKDEWLFVSAAVIEELPESSIFNEEDPKANQAKIKVIDKYKPYFGKLIINLNKGNKYSRYAFLMETFLSWNPTVKELLPTKYSGEKFEGYDKVHLEYKKLKFIFNGTILPTYRETLEGIKGVYCLTDNKTGKLYIGSATGTEGVAQRWGNYLNSRHGGNKKLIKLDKEEGKGYFEENFSFSIIEYLVYHMMMKKSKNVNNTENMFFQQLKTDIMITKIH
ncbi:hypothetical protein [Mycoplasma sp. CSL10166]|uniref:hypothetical protein n=1 Tax=Mycoplasma sp. CSL10166 TaxID=2813825 RepID=UPI00197B31C8|nr:hypothetical protein [Mycoplasma sp. CSL10166]MBN4084343.1 hypothetical protein [Mycoplasma sp. CSL10166]